jgi:hypothetical protein
MQNIRKGKSVVWQRGLAGHGQLMDCEIAPHEFGKSPEELSNPTSVKNDCTGNQDIVDTSLRGETSEVVGSSLQYFQHGFTEYQQKQKALFEAWKDIRMSLRNALIVSEAENVSLPPCFSGKCGSEQFYQRSIDCIYFEGNSSHCCLITVAVVIN